MKGFRFDVVNLISKGAFEDDLTGDGRKYYTDGPNIHKYLKELHDMTLRDGRGDRDRRGDVQHFHRKLLPSMRERIQESCPWYSVFIT